MALFNNSEKYKWEFENIGGSSRVSITTGEDIAHLNELDPKMWTVLSCPVKGLEIDEKSLAFMDCDGDGKLRVGDVVCMSQWLTGALKNPDMLLKGEDHISVENFDQENPDGQKLYKAAKGVLTALGKADDVVSLADVTNVSAIFAGTRFNGDGVITETSTDDDQDKAAIAAAVASLGGLADRSGAQGVDAAMIETFYKTLADYVAWCDAAVEAPYGADTDKVIELYNSLDSKVKDFFMRSKLAAFSPDSTSVLDVQTSSIQAISTDNLTSKGNEIAAYPIARVTGKSEIDLTSPVNPAWASSFNALKALAVDPSAKVLTEDDWTGIGSKISAYSAWKGGKAGVAVEALGLEKVKELLDQNRKEALLAIAAQDASYAEDFNNISLVEKFLYVYRDFYRLLKNFVTFHDFYSKDSDVKAIFQCGRLVIDQRECHFCMQVADMAKQNTMAASSGMYLIYCDCTTKTKPTKMSIVAAMTVGEVGDLFVGKNAVWYDNAGLEWDAVITKIIDNPISISQAFWSPYRRIAVAIENLINKNAADKDAKFMKEATEKINAAPATLPAAAADGTKPAAATPFDIGKFAGIFAALGMAVGMIGTALTNIFEGIFALPWWKVLLAFVGVMLVISGPAMVMAWLKLRRRNIAPLLNANGWAVNAASKISIPFGETLTEIAKFPAIKLKDPYAKKGMPVWKRWVISISSLVVVLAVLWLVNLFAWAKLPSPLPWFDKDEPVLEEVVETVTETVVVEEVAE
ncbi:MAG: hypothetical protein IKY95_07450 [Bacteroidales bacterium]|nr:hypothetical protein [Bacteroidales bacterium]